MHYERKVGVIAERSGERTVILDAEGATVITLNPVGAIVWEALPADIGAMIGALRARFPDVDEQTLREDTLGFVAELSAHSLIDIDAGR